MHSFSNEQWCVTSSPPPVGNSWSGLAIGAVFIGVAVFALFSGALEMLGIRESNYFCIKVRARDVDGREVRVLYLHVLLHSYVDVDDP